MLAAVLDEELDQGQLWMDFYFISDDSLDDSTQLQAQGVVEGSALLMGRRVDEVQAVLIQQKATLRCINGWLLDPAILGATVVDKDWRSKPQHQAQMDEQVP